MPIIFLNVILLLRIIALVMRTIIGVAVMIRAEFRGEVRFSPLKKHSWLMATPNIPQKSNLSLCSFLIFSTPAIKRIGKKKIKAPVTRANMNPEGPIKPGIRPLAKR